MKKSLKHGFGLIEVLIAAVVLGFLLVGLNITQKGNRESIIRVRARDAANVVAQDVIDSISALGSASVPNISWSCKEATGMTTEPSLCRKRDFTGTAGNVTVPYSVTVEVKQDPEFQAVNEETFFVEVIKNQASADFKNINVKHNIAKQMDVTVEWDFKNSKQSINVSSIIR